MSTDASVAMKVEDNLSAAVVSMRNCMTAFRGDVKSLQGGTGPAERHPRADEDGSHRGAA